MKALLGLLVALPLAANAETKSEFFYQPEANAHDISFSYSSFAMEVEFTNQTYEINSDSLGVEYEYGFDSHRAIGVGLKYSTGDQGATTKVDSAGLEDIELLYKAHSEMGSGNLTYGATLELSPGDSETDSNGDVNNYSGGMGIVPYVGWESTSDSCHWGARASLEIELADKSFDDKQTPQKGEKSGGEETVLSVFMEHMFSDKNRLGGEFSYITTADEDTTVSGATTTEEALSPFMSLTVYGRMDDIGGGSLLPSLTYRTSSDDKFGGNDVDSATGIDFSIAYRMEI